MVIIAVPLGRYAAPEHAKPLSSIARAAEKTARSDRPGEKIPSAASGSETTTLQIKRLARERLAARQSRRRSPPGPPARNADDRALSAAVTMKITCSAPPTPASATAPSRHQHGVDHAEQRLQQVLADHRRGQPDHAPAQLLGRARRRRLRGRRRRGQRIRHQWTWPALLSALPWLLQATVLFCGGQSLAWCAASLRTMPATDLRLYAVGSFGISMPWIAGGSMTCHSRAGSRSAGKTGTQEIQTALPNDEHAKGATNYLFPSPRTGGALGEGISARPRRAG